MSRVVADLGRKVTRSLAFPILNAPQGRLSLEPSFTHQIVRPQTLPLSTSTPSDELNVTFNSSQPKPLSWALVWSPSEVFCTKQVPGGHPGRTKIASICLDGCPFLRSVSLDTDWWVILKAAQQIIHQEGGGRLSPAGRPPSGYTVLSALSWWLAIIPRSISFPQA